jgi:hypothetical protein
MVAGKALTGGWLGGTNMTCGTDAIREEGRLFVAGGTEHRIMQAVL